MTGQDQSPSDLCGRLFTIVGLRCHMLSSVCYAPAPPLQRRPKSDTFLAQHRLWLRNLML